MEKISFSLVGGGWRSEFYLRIAKALPEIFAVSGVLLRDVEKRVELQERWGVRAYSSLEELAEADSAFTVVSVSKTAAPGWITELARRGLAVLAETPPAPDTAGLDALLAALPSDARVQVAEQYQLQPAHQARTKLLQSGLFGEPVHVQVSAAHGYHGISLIRCWLGHEGDIPVPCTVSAQRLVTPVLEGRVRDKLPEAERLKQSDQDIAVLRFDNGQSAVLDFTGEQYFSPIRRNRVLIRGTRGEIRDSSFDYMADMHTAISGELKRTATGGEGSLEPLSLNGIQWGGRWFYRNPFHPVSLTDEELAMAEMLQRMGSYAKAGGEPIYSLQSAVIDTKLALCIEEAVISGTAIRFDG